MRRRDFIKGIAGSGVFGWPLKQADNSSHRLSSGFSIPDLEVVGARLSGFRQGLKETSYVEGENVAIIYRWAEDQIQRLPALATDLVRRPVTVTIAQALNLRSRRRRQPRRSPSSSWSAQTRWSLA